MGTRWPWGGLKGWNAHLDVDVVSNLEEAPMSLCDITKGWLPGLCFSPHLEVKHGLHRITHIIGNMNFTQWQTCKQTLEKEVFSEFALV